MVTLPGARFFDEQSLPYRFWVTAQDITPLIETRQKLDSSQDRFRSVLEHAPVPTCLFVGRDFQIELANEAMIQVWGKGPAILGKPLIEALPELRGQVFLPLLDRLFTTGDTTHR